MDVTSLQEQFCVVTDVRIAGPQPENHTIFQNHTADLVVHTWMGSSLHVYLLDTVPKVRDLRGILKENSRNGIGTLFMVNSTLLPEPARQFTIVEWQEALKSLNEGAIYAYAPDCKIHQVHFNPTPLAEQFQTWHFPNFAIEHVSVRKRTIADGGLKGEWYLGDIASPAFKRRINYERVNQRFHYTTREAPRSVASTPSDQLSKAYAMLNLDRNASEKEVKTAFRRLAMNVHPDVSSLPRSEAERRIKELIQAYDLIKEYNNWS
jgi:hypothetical protein